MKLLTHITIGIIVLIYLYLFNILVPITLFSSIMALLIMALASVLPDLDIYFDNMFPKYKIFQDKDTGEIKKVRVYRFHRKLFHNIIIPLVFAVLVMFSKIGILPEFLFPYFIIIAIGTATHILFDAFTPLGVVIIGKKKVKGKLRSPSADLIAVLVLVITLYILLVIIKL